MSKKIMNLSSYKMIEKSLVQKMYAHKILS